MRIETTCDLMLGLSLIRDCEIVADKTDDETTLVAFATRGDDLCYDDDWLKIVQKHNDERIAIAVKEELEYRKKWDA